MTKKRTGFYMKLIIEMGHEPSWPKLVKWSCDPKDSFGICERRQPWSQWLVPSKQPSRIQP